MADGAIVTIESLGARGDGVARMEEAPVYVEGALPGETWRIEKTGKTERIGEPGTGRQTPVCPHFHECGGCVAQHMTPKLYRAWKHDIVRKALDRNGINSEIESFWSVSPGRRRRATFTVRKGQNAVKVGYQGRASHVVFDVMACPVLGPGIVEAVDGIRALGNILLRPNNEAKVRVTRTASGIALALGVNHGGRTMGPDERIEIAEIAQNAGYAHLSLNDEILFSEARPTINYGGVSVLIPDQIFLQAGPDAEVKMQALVSGIVDDAGSIADLFCGAGTFALPLAKSRRVTAYDYDKGATDALAHAVRNAQGLKPLEVVRKDLFREPLASRELVKFAAVVINPPRAGAKAQCAELAASDVPTAAMVSCNPATFARDARILIDGGYRIATIHLVDQFLWSHHVEIVAAFHRP